jgi:hypothetical protein
MNSQTQFSTSSHAAAVSRGTCVAASGAKWLLLLLLGLSREMQKLAGGKTDCLRASGGRPGGWGA